MLEYMTNIQPVPGQTCKGIPEGGLPVDLQFKEGSEALVRWLPFGSHCIVEPFLFQTIAALKRKAPRPREFLTDLGVLISQGAVLPPLKPAGIIFHIGRCGSTMLSNVLRTAEGSVVVSEAGIFDSICRPADFWRPPVEWELLQSQLLDSTVRIFGYHQCKNPNVVIKTTSIGIFDIPLFRMVWPDVPSVIIIRDPIEIMMSFLQKPASFLLQRSSTVVLKVFGWQKPDVDAMTVVEYYARHLGRLCEIGYQHVWPGCQVIDYEELSAEKICKIGDLFTLHMPPPDSPKFLTAMSLYSKSPAKGSPFKSDRETKQRSATELVREAVGRWAEGPYLALRKLTGTRV